MHTRASFLPGLSVAVISVDDGKDVLQLRRKTFARNTGQLSKFSVLQYAASCLLAIAKVMTDAEQYMLCVFL
jgi:hypothetical protein